MRSVFKKISPYVILSLVTIIFYVAGILVLANPFGTILYMIIFYSIPLLFLCYYKEIKSINELWLSGLITTVCTITPISLIWGWILTSFPMDEFDINKPFDYSEFIYISVLAFILFFVTTYSILLVVGGIKLKSAKR